MPTPAHHAPLNPTTLGAAVWAPQEISPNFFYQPRALSNSESFTLLDSGHGKKLEAIGDKKFIRPEPQALWQPHQPQQWQGAHAQFATSDDQRTSRNKGEKDSFDQKDGLGKWMINKPLPDKWLVNHFGLPLVARLTPFRHYGFFPEQALLWPEMLAINQAHTNPAVLNLFAYSGMASLLLARGGAAVTHVDASKKAIAYAGENIPHEMGVRLLIDDAMDFLRRAVRRGAKYHLIILDPPKFGRGPKGEEWDIWRDLPDLLSLLPPLLAQPGPSAIFLTAYAIRASCYSIGRALHETFGGAPQPQSQSRGTTTFGELSLTEAGRGFYIPQAVYATHHIP